MRVAILVDAAFFIRRYGALVPNGRDHEGKIVAECLHEWACRHLGDDGAGHATPAGSRGELYRIFVYDCPPFSGKLHHPLSGAYIDFAKTGLYQRRTAFHERLKQLRKVALRLGHLGDVRNWAIKPAVQADLLRGRRDLQSLTEEDVTLDTKQKGVDMRIGVDVASLAFKKQVDRIILVAGDADFVPAAKLARREGLDFVLDSMHATIAPSLYEHIDGLVSMSPKPANHQDEKHPPKDFAPVMSYEVELPHKSISEQAAWQQMKPNLQTIFSAFTAAAHGGVQATASGGNSPSQSREDGDNKAS